MKVIVTGATGFIGKRFVEMSNKKYAVSALSLRNDELSKIDMHGVDVIVHLAGMAHEIKRINDQLFYKVNYDLTHDLAEKALAQNVPHFIYISTIKVYGDETNKILNEHSACCPTGAYGKSKLQAEDYLQSIVSNMMTIAIVRPPLVYGPEVKGNMLRLLELSNKNIPLPFANIDNLRSMVYVDNLVELIFAIIEKKASGIFLASDEKPISTGNLLRLIKKDLHKKSSLFNMPKIACLLLKKSKPDLYKRLYGSFVIDNLQTNTLLNFQPPFTTSFGISKMVDWFKTLQ